MVAEATVGAIRVVSTVDSRPVERGLQRQNRALRNHRTQLSRTQRTYQSTAASAQTFATRLGGVAGALGIGIAGAGLATGIRQLSMLGANLVETARSADLSVESLQNLRFVAESDGVAADQLDRALLRLNRTLGEGQAGGKRAIETFAALGLEIEDIANLQGEERFLAIARAIQQLGDRTLQTEAATRIFGRAGQDLLPVLIQNEDALRNTIDRSEELGNVSEEHAQNLKDLEQSYADLEKIAVSALANMVGAFIDVRTEAQNLARDLVGFSADEGVSLFEAFSNVVGSDFDLEAARRQQQGIPDVSANVSEPERGFFGRQIDALFGSDDEDRVEGLQNSLEALEVPIDNIVTSTQDQAKARQEVNDATDGSISAADRYRAALKGEADEARAARDASRELAAERRAAQNIDVTSIFQSDIAAIEESNRQLQNQIRLHGLVGQERARVLAQIQLENQVVQEEARLQRLIVMGTMEQAEAARARLDALDEYVRTTGPQLVNQYEQEFRAQQDLTSQAEALNEQERELEQTTRDLERSNQELERTIDGVFDGIINGADDASGSIRQLAGPVLNSLIDSLFATGNQASSFGDIFSRGISGGRGGGGGGFLDGLFDSIFGGFRQRGGPVVPGFDYIVGETGPERLRIGAPGNVSPLGGGNVINIAINVPRDEPGIRRAILETVPVVERAVRQGITADAGRNSELSQSIRRAR